MVGWATLTSHPPIQTKNKQKPMSEPTLSELRKEGKGLQQGSEHTLNNKEGNLKAVRKLRSVFTWCCTTSRPPVCQQSEQRQLTFPVWVPGPWL